MLTVLHKEFTEKLADLVNTSGLPAFIMLSVLKECEQALAVLANQQLQRDLEKEGTNGTDAAN